MNKKIMNGKGRDSKRIKKPWPTKDVMEQIYSRNLWGGENADFYSGEGSHLPEYVNPYIDALQAFLKSFESPITVCDLGCGDFNVGKELVNFTGDYIAVDIVSALIKFNKKNFRQENLQFLCLDIANDNLPPADCAILRQVLQHLSNAEVQRIVHKLPDYKYVILTEHIPSGDFEPNKDIISGQSIRLKKNSGLDLSSPPFNLKAKAEKQLLSINLNNSEEVLLTTLYTMF